MSESNQIDIQVLEEESKFILQKLEEEEGIRYANLKNTIEPSLSLRLSEYIQFLEKYGYLLYDRNTNQLELTLEGAKILRGIKLEHLSEAIRQGFADLLGEPDPAQEIEGELIGGRYVKASEIGSGGIGDVYHGYHALLKRPLAIKEIVNAFSVFSDVRRDDIINRLTREVTTAASLIHPNIVQILDLNLDSEFPFIVTEYCPGGNLRKVIDQAPRPTLKILLQYFLQILFALRHAHNKGVLHGDLKPENVLLDDNGNAKLSDFGIARIIEGDGRQSNQIYVGVGTVAYLSPEGFRSSSAITQQSDIYSLGIMLYELLTGKLPGRRSPMPSSFNPEIPRSVDDIFDKMAMDYIEDRYNTIDEILNDFFNSPDIMSIMDKHSAILFITDPFGDEKLAFTIQKPEVPLSVHVPPSQQVRAIPAKPKLKPKPIPPKPAPVYTPTPTPPAKFKSGSMPRIKTPDMIPAITTPISTPLPQDFNRTPIPESEAHTTTTTTRTVTKRARKGRSSILDRLNKIEKDHFGD